MPDPIASIDSSWEIFADLSVTGPEPQRTSLERSLRAFGDMAFKAADPSGAALLKKIAKGHSLKIFVEELPPDAIA